MLGRIKTMLGINDTIQDEVIDILITNVNNHLKGLLGKEVPEEMNYIVEEITIRRYNNLGSEGMKSESVEGHTIQFYDMNDYFSPYRSIIDAEKDEDYSGGRGRVIFI